MALGKHWMTSSEFESSARELRNHYDKIMIDPRLATPERFQWDYWHVPDQYTLLRTPAYHYFPKRIYERFHRQIVMWGREQLGCHDISPPWLSCYVEGCRQNLHADQPHGPWAFVFSLTPWSQRKFGGGETVLLNPDCLTNWHAPQQSGFEYKDLTVRIPPRFGQLTIFDPRIPHGVETVTGTNDPREGRLVIHGWFVKPRPFWRGSLKLPQISRILNEGVASLGANLQAFEISGYLSLRLKILSSGKVAGIQLLTNTLVGEPNVLKNAHRLIQKQVSQWKFAASKGATLLTLPLHFGL